MARGTEDSAGCDIGAYVVDGSDWGSVLRADKFIAGVERKADSILHDVGVLVQYGSDARVEVCVRVPEPDGDGTLEDVEARLLAETVREVLPRVIARDPRPIATYVALNTIARRDVAVAAARCIPKALDFERYLQLLRLLAEVSAYFTSFTSAQGALFNRRLFAPMWAALAGRYVPDSFPTVANACYVDPRAPPRCRHIIGHLPMEVITELGFESGSTPDNVVAAALRNNVALPTLRRPQGALAVYAGIDRRLFHPRMIFVCRACMRVFPHVDETARKTALHAHLESSGCVRGAPLNADSGEFRRHFVHVLAGLTPRQAAAFVDAVRAGSADSVLLLGAAGKLFCAGSNTDHTQLPTSPALHVPPHRRLGQVVRRTARYTVPCPDARVLSHEAHCDHQHGRVTGGCAAWAGECAV